MSSRLPSNSEDSFSITICTVMCFQNFYMHSDVFCRCKSSTTCHGVSCLKEFQSFIEHFFVHVIVLTWCYSLYLLRSKIQVSLNLSQEIFNCTCRFITNTHVLVAPRKHDHFPDFSETIDRYYFWPLSKQHNFTHLNFTSSSHELCNPSLM